MENRKHVRRWPVLAVLLAVTTWSAAHARNAGAGSSGRWAKTLVGVEITRKVYDYQQPWARRSQTVQKPGIVVGPGEVLTTAHLLSDHTVVRLQRNGRGVWYDAAVRWVDYPGGLALITTTNAAFWKGLEPARLSKNVSRDGDLQILRWRGGTLESRKAEFNRFTVRNPGPTEPAHVLLQLTSEIEGAGWGEAVVRGKEFVGLVFAQGGNFCQAVPAPFIRTVLDAQRQGTYRGIGYFDFTWQPTENPETQRYLKVPGEGRGVVVIDVADKPGVTPVLHPRDVLLEVDGFAIDNQGDYVDPAYGHLLLENLATRGKWAGDTVRFKVWRDGRALDVDYVLPKIQEAGRLVPESPNDREPEYLVAGGLVFQPLTREYLQSWGQDWERMSPFRLAYFRNEYPSRERPALVVLSMVLPDVFNLGYQEVRNLVLEKVNGRRVSTLRELEEVLRQPQGDFHVLEFLVGETLQRIVLDARQLDATTRRVLERYGIERDRVVFSQ